jgi:alpha-amylase
LKSRGKTLSNTLSSADFGQHWVQYNDYFVGWKADTFGPDDPIDDGWTGGVLTNEIDSLIDARRKYAGGATIYLSTSNTTDLFIMKREGNGTKPGCILVLNDHLSSTLADSVYTGWISTNLVDALQTNVTVSTDGSGVASLSAPARGYRVFVRQGDL